MIYNLIQLVQLAGTVFTLLVVARVLISWFNPDPRNVLVQLIYSVTEPVMGRVRELLPSMGGIDFSPMLVLIGVQILERVLVRVLAQMI